MPSTGTPSSNTAGGACGGCASVTEARPPQRLSALGNELFKLGGCVLKISVGGAEAFGHRTERAHAAIGFVGCSLIKLDLARGLLGAGKKAANHDRVGARSDRFGDVAGIANAAVGYDRNARIAQCRGN